MKLTCVFQCTHETPASAGKHTEVMARETDNDEVNAMCQPAYTGNTERTKLTNLSFSVPYFFCINANKLKD